MNTRKALITGATDGIGKALALKLLQENYKVTIIGRSQRKVETTVKELKSKCNNKNIFGITADLSVMPAVNSACVEFLQTNTTLDLLVLNANAIANDRIITGEGNEKNFAVGYLSRVLMIHKLEKLLENTPGSQILSVIGLDVSRIDFDDLTIKKNFTGRRGLTRWQWAINLHAKYYNEHSKVPVNLYMPGLVKTKILKNEPQPMRLFVQIMNVIMGLTPERAAENMYKAIQEIDVKRLRNATFSYSRQRKPIKIETRKGDIDRLLTITENLLERYEK